MFHGLLLLFCTIGIVHGQTYDVDSTIDTLVNNDGYNAQQQQQTVDIEYYKIHRVNSQARTHDFHSQLINSSIDFTNIECRNYRDFYQLIYSICNQSILCSEMYYLDNRASNNDYNFRKFVYQLSLSQLFLVHDYNSPLSLEEQASYTQLFLLEDNVPIEWIPHYIINLRNTTNVTCATSVNLYSSENINFVHSTTYLLHAYKYYVQNDYQCNQFNEWLILDSHNRPHCECRPGKSCDDDTNNRTIIIILTVVIMVLLLVWIISLFTTTPKLIAKIDEANRLKKRV